MTLEARLIELFKTHLSGRCLDDPDDRREVALAVRALVANAMQGIIAGALDRDNWTEAEVRQMGLRCRPGTCTTSWSALV